MRARKAALGADDFRDKLLRTRNVRGDAETEKQTRRRQIAAACAEELRRKAAELKAKQAEAPNAESRDTRRFIDKFLNDIPFCTCVVSLP